MTWLYYGAHSAVVGILIVLNFLTVPGKKTKKTPPTTQKDNARARENVVTVRHDNYVTPQTAKKQPQTAQKSTTRAARNVLIVRPDDDVSPEAIKQNNSRDIAGS